MSRRLALGGGVMGIGALLATARRAPTVGQADTATPVAAEATPVADTVTLLFVQVFETCTLTPASDDPTALTMTLTGGTGQTLYFSDRPDRLVGLIETEHFVRVFGEETADDPANAALLALGSETNDATHVVELLDLAYDATSRTATYTVRLLPHAEAIDLQLAHEPIPSLSTATRYGASHLFIDAGGLMQLVAYGAQDVENDENAAPTRD